ncbi:alkaline phosphatase family protein [Mycolicibacterium mengxianglii]|uniref:alkaline phosphatase family protein n=1 Tax=Mycolicibacterium mengxianglii TaxID=2736649 RepID=UPI0018EEF2BB|nr:nucleotide pyrophosphatase/phosphodiesterase family protein [Mycolicibacterium mengxianglii]
MSLPQPDSSLPHLADVVPSILAAMDIHDLGGGLDVGSEVAGACVLLIDGLGADLLDTYAADAPVLAGLRGQTLQVGFPSTTAAGLAAIGTGRRSGQHGMVGYSFRLPTGDPDSPVFNALRWRPHPWGPDLRDTLIPEDVQPLPTTFERAAAAGVAVSVVSGSEFAGSGLTRAVLRGATYVGVHALGDLAAGVSRVLDDRGFCYGYHSELDLVGHLYGPGSAAWRMQLRQVDRLVESVVDALPAGALLAVVADHGMVTADPAQVVDIDSAPHLLAGVHSIGGEPRARHVYVTAGADASVADTWREALAGRAWVASRDEAIEAGWFGGPVSDRVRHRIGDLVVAATESAVLVRRQVEPSESALVGHHGSLTPAEQRVPLLLARG